MKTIGLSLPQEEYLPKLAGRVMLEVSPVLKKRIEEIPGLRFHRPSARWHLPQAWPAMVCLGVVAVEAGAMIEPDGPVAAWVMKEKAHAEAQTRLAELITIPEVRRSELGVAHDLYGHQDVGSAWLSRVRPGEGVLLLDETGAGKTRTVLAGIDRTDALAQASTADGPVLVICPNTVKASWGGEIAMYHGIKEGQVALVDGTAVQRRKALARVAAGDARFAVINFEALRLHTKITAFPGQTVRKCPDCGGVKSGDKVVTVARCQSHVRELNEIPWAWVIADEAHRLKNPKADITQAAWGVVDTAPVGVRRLAMTGTPLADTPEDLWPLLRFADPHGFPVKSAWVERYCRTGFDWFGVWRVEGLKPEQREEMDRWWRPINRRVLKAQVLDLPPLTRGGSLTRWVEMATAQKRAYHEMKEDMVAQIKGGEITASDLLQRANRLFLLASAYGTPGADESQLDLVLPSCKIETLVADLAAGDHGGGSKPLVVTMVSRRLLRLLEQHLMDKLGWGPDDVAVIAGDVSTKDREIGRLAFQAGNRKVLLMTYGAGGTGITLTAADTMILLQRSWSAIEMKQAMDRVHRIGSQIHTSVAIVDYVTRGSVEEGQIRKISEKEDVLEDLVHDRAALLELLEAS